jgi:hypothetical protein
MRSQMGMAPKPEHQYGRPNSVRLVRTSLRTSEAPEPFTQVISSSKVAVRPLWIIQRDGPVRELYCMLRWSLPVPANGDRKLPRTEASTTCNTYYSITIGNENTPLITVIALL